MNINIETFLLQILIVAIGLTFLLKYSKQEKTIEVKFKKIEPEASIPEYQTEGAVGADICSFEDATIEAGKIKAIRTGLACELPLNYEMQVRPRSGKALNPGITVNNSPGTIDPDYRGEIKVILINHGDAQFIIKKGDRIAQIVIAHCPKTKFITVTDLSDTDRGTGGFGSTGTTKK
jgi:dUTP pyrophosphatase